MVALYKENYVDCLRINIYIQYLSFDGLHNTVWDMLCIIAVHHNWDLGINTDNLVKLGTSFLWYHQFIVVKLS